MIRQSRREFVKKAAYIPPVILSLAAAPSYAKAGSHKEPNPPGPVSRPDSMFPSSRPIVTPPGPGK
jgi:hypothetical protein